MEKLPRPYVAQTLNLHEFAYAPNLVSALREVADFLDGDGENLIVYDVLFDMTPEGEWNVRVYAVERD